MEKPKALIYVRVSDPNQVDGTSLDTQEKECLQYCSEHGFEAIATFREEGESAKDLRLKNREQLLRALHLCRKNQGRVRHFVVFRVDRFSRRTEDHFAIRKILSDNDVTLHSVTENIGDDPSQKFVETVLAGIAEYDNAIRRRRSMDGMAARITQGIYPWKPPVGYISERFNRRGEKKTTPDRPDSIIFPIIQRGLSQYAKDICTQTQLGNLLDEWGLAEARGRPTSRTLIDRLLGQYLNFYAGIITNPWTGEQHQGHHKPMISREQLQRIKMLRSGSPLAVKRIYFNPVFPLRQTVCCATCGHRLTGGISQGTGGRYAYYRCYKLECSRRGKAIPKDILENAFEELLQQIRLDNRFLSLLKDDVIDFYKESRSRIHSEQKKSKKRLLELEVLHQRLFEMREDGSYTKTEFLERKRSVDNEITSLTLSLRPANDESVEMEATLANVFDFVQNFGANWSKMRPVLQAKFKKLVFPNGIAYDPISGFTTPELGLIYSLNQTFLEGKYPTAGQREFDLNLLLAEIKEFKAVQAYENSVEPESEAV